jgi:hypothetical protein
VKARAFDALVACLSGIVRSDRNALRAALRSCSSGALLRQTFRHRCEGILLDGILAAKVRDELPSESLAILKHRGGRAVVQNALLVRQIAEVVRTLRDGGVANALLKTGARLYAGDPQMHSTAICDIDILIRRCDAARACAALLGAGYRTESQELAALYERRHHHLAPFYGSETQKPVELHLALAPPGKFSVKSDWDALASRMETIDGPGGPTLRLDAVGEGMHRVLHGIGLYRLFDVVVLALDMRENPRVAGALERIFSEETTQPIGARAVIASAARMAGVEAAADANAGTYLGWISRREELPAFLRLRAQFADAYFGNGRRVVGPCTRLAAAHVFCRHPSAAERLTIAYRTAGRAFVGFVAMGYPVPRRR